MKRILTPPVLNLIHILDNNARVVGGAVRDYLSGIIPYDIDLATPLLPDEVLYRLTQAGIRTMTAGIKHGTVMAIIDKTPYEITTLRTDTKTDGRHAEVAFTDSYEQDAKRRDFTVNALYMDAQGTIYDYVGGQEDLKNNLIRFIGNADTRVQEDYLRILRYFRFWGKLGYGKKDNDAIQACQKFAPSLTSISKERKREELLKILALDRCDKVMYFMDECHVLSEILPHTDIPALTAFLKVCPWADVWERLSVLTNGSSPDLGLSRAHQKDLADLAASIDFSNDLVMERLRLYRIKERPFKHHIYRALSQNKLDKHLAQTLLDLKMPFFPLKGADFIKAGFNSGPHIQKLLQSAELFWAQNGFCDNKTLVLNQFLAYNRGITK
ncbi:MAG: CCA tRNA nucleotidyltransferase [Alphaproteobacteria bacterium]|nr:CCA tRNA nucleotidyltransferase [Alphaproteobacteria bacterium]